MPINSYESRSKIKIAGAILSWPFHSFTLKDRTYQRPTCDWNSGLCIVTTSSALSRLNTRRIACQREAVQKQPEILRKAAGSKMLFCSGASSNYKLGKASNACDAVAHYQTERHPTRAAVCFKRQNGDIFLHYVHPSKTGIATYKHCRDKN